MKWPCVFHFRFKMKPGTHLIFSRVEYHFKYTACPEKAERCMLSPLSWFNSIQQLFFTSYYIEQPIPIIMTPKSSNFVGNFWLYKLFLMHCHFLVSRFPELYDKITNSIAKYNNYSPQEMAHKIKSFQTNILISVSL